MALVHCKECGKEISSQATICPNCGAKTETAKYKKKSILKVLLFVTILAIIITIYLLTICFKETDAQKQMRETEGFRKSIKNNYDIITKNY